MSSTPASCRLARRCPAEQEVLDWVARDAETALHPSCTCAMGTGPISVTDPLSLRVHGVDGLRVVDASVMPYVTNGNIYAPVMMTAEKAADLILGNTPLAPEPLPFYRQPQRRRSEHGPAGQWPAHGAGDSGKWTGRDRHPNGTVPT